MASRKKHKKKNFFEHLRNSYASFRTHIKHVPKLFIVDFLFFMAFAVIYSFFALRIIDKLIEVQFLIAEMTLDAEALESMAPEAMQALVSQQEAMFIVFKDIMILVGLLALCFYVLWVVFQSISWHMIHSLDGKAKKKVKFWNYLGRFSVVTLIWFMIMGVFTYFLVKFSVMASSTHIPLFHTPSGLLFALMGWVVFYFVLTTYYLAGTHTLKEVIINMLPTSFKHILVLMPGYIMFTLKIFLAVKITQWLKLPELWTVIVGVSLALLAFLWAKMFFVGVLKELEVEG